MAATAQNRRAVRMLGYNSVEVTAENVEHVREYDAKLQEVLKELHPAVTVRMIREGINPLEQSIDDLASKIAQIKEEEGITTEDNYSIFLINLDKKKEISPEERKAYMWEQMKKQFEEEERQNEMVRRMTEKECQELVEKLKQELADSDLIDAKLSVLGLNSLDAFF